METITLIYGFRLPVEQSDDSNLRTQVANVLLFTEVEPATVFGRPAPERVLISLKPCTVRW